MNGKTVSKPIAAAPVIVRYYCLFSGTRGLELKEFCGYSKSTFSLIPRRVGQWLSRQFWELAVGGSNPPSPNTTNSRQ